MNALYRGLAVAGGISAVAFLPVIFVLMGSQHFWGLWGSALVGLGLTAAMVVVTEYYTATEFSPVQKLAEACTTGHATNIPVSYTHLDVYKRQGYPLATRDCGCQAFGLVVV